MWCMSLLTTAKKRGILYYYCSMTSDYRHSFNILSEKGGLWETLRWKTDIGKLTWRRHCWECWWAWVVLGWPGVRPVSSLLSLTQASHSLQSGQFSPGEGGGGTEWMNEWSNDGKKVKKESWNNAEIKYRISYNLWRNWNYWIFW